MPSNKALIEAHLKASDRKSIGAHLADDVEWVEWGEGVPATGVLTKGRQAYIDNFGDDQVQTEIVRMIEEDDVVIAEGIARITKNDGKKFQVRFVDVFEVEHGKIKRKSSWGALLKDAK
jgi:uncharacterized protein